MGGLGLWLDVCHSLTVASGTPNDGHSASIFPAKFGGTDRHINDGFIDQHRFTADRTAVGIFLRRRAERFVRHCRADRLVTWATHISPLLWPRVHHRCPHIWGAISSDM